MNLFCANYRPAGLGSIVNDVGLTYNSFGQLVSDAQSHSGAVVPGTTPQVQYAYADGSANTIRPTTLTYPNGRAVTTSYGTTGGINDSLSRVDGLIDGSTTLVTYSYLGMGVPVQTTYPQPGIQYTLLGSSSGTSPAGDIYWGLDLFGRIIDSRWFNTSTSADVDRIRYGYDRVSNRIWRQNPVATAAGAAFDEFYTNDGLQRLKDMQRGTLNGTNTGITSPTFKQCWTLDPTGNWTGFNESTNGSTWTLNQTRTSNPVNEITNIGTTTGTEWAIPAYDAAGNMTNIPITSGPLTSMGWADLTVDQWSGLSVDDWNTLPLAGTTDSYTATYDAWNRLVKLVTLSTGNTVQQNQYDARTFRTVIQTYTSGVLSETRHSYFSAGWRCLEERTGTSTTPERQFVWGNRYIDDLVCRTRTSETLYAMQDANWNVTSIADATGAVQERYAYSAYGTPRYLTPTFGSRPATGFDWERLFCGYRYDDGPRFFHVRYRTYIPDLGTWASRDPIGLSKVLSLYGYSSSRPLIAVDPFGLTESTSDCDDETESPAQRWRRQYLRRWPSSISFDLQQQAERGCIGYVCAALGVPPEENEFFQNGPPNFSVTECYNSLSGARNGQRRRQCAGNNVFGTPARARIVQIQFNDTLWSDQFGNYTLPAPGFSGPDPESPAMNFEDPAMNYPMVNRRRLVFWDYVHHGGSGFHGFGNFDVALLTDEGDWLHGTKAGEPPRFDSEGRLDRQFENATSAERQRLRPDESRDPQEFSFNRRVFCVVCESPH